MNRCPTCKSKRGPRWIRAPYPFETARCDDAYHRTLESYGYGARVREFWARRFA